MNPLAVLLLCLIATSAVAQEFEFRGDFVETYMAKDGFLDSIPSGTLLNCQQGLCSSSKSVRIYVFRNRETTRTFWSTDYLDVMFDEPERLLACGNSGHIVSYDETNQLLFRQQLCHEGVNKQMPGNPHFPGTQLRSAHGYRSQSEHP